MRILITGASSGIGAALARTYAARGDHVWLAARRRDRLDAEVAAITERGGVAHAVTLDVQDADAVEERVLALDEEAGGFDIVIANAGVGGKGATASGLRYADTKAVFEVNLLGTIATLLAAQQAMLSRGRGQLVAVSSLAGELPLPVALDYGTSKAALSYFVKAMRYDLAPRGVDVTLVHPGFVKSEMTDKNAFPMPFIVDTEKAARIVVRAIDKKAALVRFPLAYRLAFMFAGLVPMRLVAHLALKSTRSGPEGMPRRP